VVGNPEIMAKVPLNVTGLLVGDQPFAIVSKHCSHYLFQITAGVRRKPPARKLRCVLDSHA